jgi:hypothetical protein
MARRSRTVGAQYRRGVGWLRSVLAASVLVWGLAGAYDRDKSDVVRMRNGDHLTGDIVSLEYGKLALKTDKMGTLSIEWAAVQSVASKFAFAIERRGGAKFYGTIATSEDGASLLVSSAEGSTAQIPMADVERISRYSLSFWNRINGNLSVGFTYTKASDTTVGSVNLLSFYRSTSLDGALSFSSNTTKTSAGGDTYRALLSGTVIFLTQSRNFWGLVGSLERDQELGINARLLGGAVAGRRFLQLPATEVTGIAGIVITQESITDNPEQKTSVEGIIGGLWRVFKFTDPETSLTFGISVFPSLTESGRVRSNGSLNLTHKIAGDFTLGLSGYFSTDNRPPDPTAQKSDYGLTFNLGYEFGQ